MARRAEGGYFYLTDRKSNMIASGGENVYPSEVENLLGDHSKVKDVAVIGVPHEKWGEAVHAVIVLYEAPRRTPANSALRPCPGQPPDRGREHGEAKGFNHKFMRPVCPMNFAEACMRKASQGDRADDRPSHAPANGLHQKVPSKPPQHTQDADDNGFGRG